MEDDWTTRKGYKQKWYKESIRWPLPAAVKTLLTAGSSSELYIHAIFGMKKLSIGAASVDVGQKRTRVQIPAVLFGLHFDKDRTDVSG